MKLPCKNRLPYWQQTILILTAGWITIWIYRTVLTPIYPIISDFFDGASNAQLGNISSFYFLGYVCMQIPSGLLVDKLGRKKILIPGFLLFALGTITVGSATTLATIYIGSVLAGLGCGTFYGAAYSFTARYVPEAKKSLANAIVNSGTAIGSGLGLVSSSFLVGQGILQWQYLLYITAALIFAMVFIFSRFILSDVQKNPATDINPIKVKSKIDSLTSSIEIGLLSSLFRPQMIAAYILYFSTLYTYYLVDTWLPNFLETEKGIEGTTVGLISSLVFFAAIPGAIFFSSIADKFFNKKIRLIIILELLASISLLVTVSSFNHTIVTISIIAYGFFGKLAVEPIIIAWLSQSASKNNLATTYGVFNFFGMSSAVIVPSLTGYISDVMHSKVYAFYLAIGIILIGTLVFYLMTKSSIRSNSIK